METIKICPNCRKPLPPDVPLGLCPECLIKAGFPTGTEPGAAGEAAGARFVPPPVGEIAQLFPQLEILSLIGKGGMGAVYKARQPALDRFVALKVLPPAVASDPGFAERFNREARALARLNHPNIVAVHDFGKAGPLHYLLMEFVDGTNLREIERAGALSPDKALAIVPQICEALQFAHNEGIVHRDIKPENLLLDKKGRVKITDFGIAKMVGIGPGQQMLTGAKDVVGTPHYMAPEQIEKPQTVDHRADIYSLGVVFYEMLTGELPLGKFAPPSKKVQIDVRLDEVVLHTLEKEPARRYQQVSQVKTDVETIAGTPPSAAGLAAKPLTFPIPASRATSDKAILPAILLAFPFGVFGAHRFYVGKIGTAFLQLGTLIACFLMIIACATTGGDFQPTLGILLGFSVFGCLIWAVIDWILILCKAFTDGQGRRMTHWLHPHNGDLKAAPSPVAGPPATPPPGGAASPALTSPTPPRAHEKTPAIGTGIIVAPAVGLMIGALWKLLSALVALFVLSGHNRWLGPMLGDLGIGSFFGVASVSLVFFKVIPALLILFGAFQMLQLRSYAWAMAAAILSIVACSLVGLPLGIWALIVLARQDVRETFARATVSPPPRTAQWSWILASVGVIAMIVTGLILAVVLVRGLVEGKPDATAGVEKSGGSSFTETAIPAATAPVPPPVRIKAGSSKPFTDSDGNVWLPDQGFADGMTTERSDDLAIANTKDPELYRSERYGMTAFSYPVPNGKYVVKLHFAETYNVINGPSGRVFTFNVEGHEFKDFDVWAKAGGAQRTYVETVNVEVTDGKLNISFIPQTENPEINGIEILPVPPVPPVQTDSNAIIVPATNASPGMALNISSQNGQVVIETTNGRLTADKVTLQNGSNNSITLTATKMDYVVAPTAPTPPVLPAPPAPASVTMSSQSTAAGTPGKTQAHRTKVLGPLTTSDPFREDFSQTLPLSANGQLRLDNVNGRIEIIGWDRSDVVIKALKHGKTQESVEATKINVAASPDEIAIHTEQPPSETGFSAIWSWFKNGGNNNATVDYAIQVPRHARLANISSVNGRVAIEDVSGDIAASTVNGEMQVRDAAGSLKLSAVNGRIAAELVSLGRGQAVSLSGVNGRIEVTLPADADAEVSVSTVNGHITSEFPSLIVKKDFPIGQHLNSTLGKGGANVKASTVNGSISIQQGKPASPPSASANPNSEAETAAMATAQTWLSFNDNGNYSRSWNQAAAFFSGDSYRSEF